MNSIIHECKENKIPGLTISYASGVLDDWSGWILENKVFANLQDVEVGEAEEIGEELASSGIAIKYCPFCGKLLHSELNQFN